ncbi:Hypothetical_protein [Hexamita inflata]|uniref:Hypothetical_protein n=1 Tax=Hexamita inflata TaxID=28002 RepID=A0AA86Q9B8_9EUKA|nr:Hypothetical protein HINF_LOCUS42365 [Hexamita inflata]
MSCISSLQKSAFGVSATHGTLSPSAFKLYLFQGEFAHVKVLVPVVSTFVLGQRAVDVNAKEEFGSNFLLEEVQEVVTEGGFGCESARERVLGVNADAYA